MGRRTDSALACVGLVAALAGPTLAGHDPAQGLLARAREATGGEARLAAVNPKLDPARFPGSSAAGFSDTLAGCHDSRARGPLSSPRYLLSQ